MATALQEQPLIVSIEADRFVFQFYSDGVLDSSNRGTNLDHAVLVVGKGTESDGTEYWRVKNSWNTSWGEQGYVRLAVTGNDFGICGV